VSDSIRPLNAVTDRAGADDRPFEAHLWTALAGVLRHRTMIVALTLCSGLVTAAVTLLMPRHYAVSASFIPQTSQAPTGGLSDLAAQYGVALGTQATQESPAFYAELLGSREILGQVLEKRYDAPGPTGKPFSGTLLQYLKVENEAFPMAQGVEKLRNLLSIRSDRGTGIVSFDVHTTNPQLSIAIGQTLLDQLADYNLRRRQSRARAEREFVEQRLAASKTELDSAEERVSEFYRQNRSIGGSPDLKATEARLERALSLRQDVFSTLNQKYESARIEEVRSTPVLTVIDSPQGTVEPVRRWTLTKTLVAMILAFLLSVGLAFLLDLSGLRRAGRSAELKEVRDLWEDAGRDLRRLAFWRRASPKTLSGS
jgi:uncharacterized protein involved in exopolysaccharide biosynthesis